MILITSAAYVNSELQPEFGSIPSAFVPIANRPLYSHQIHDLRTTFPNEDIYVSLPDSFEISAHHRMKLESSGVSIIYSKPELDLKSSVLSALMSIDNLDSPVRILHGDTLISPVPSDLDIVAIAKTQDDYPWEVEDDEADSEVVWCGYFAFADTHELVRSLVLSDSFTNAVKKYDQKFRLSRVTSESWEDFGHANTYFRARQNRTTERSFNSISVTDGVLVKTGEPVAKIQAEANWFESLPIELKPFAPAYYGKSRKPDKGIEYNIEFLLSLPLNESYVHSINHPGKWEQVFDSIDNWFFKASKYDSISPNFQDVFRRDMIVTKSWERFTEYSEKNLLNMDSENWYDGMQLPSYRRIIEELIKKASTNDFVPGFLHGDLCFSNIIFDSRSKQIKLIDPRGKLFSDNSQTVELSMETSTGDLTYDVAKLSHSVIGMYDFIIADAYLLSNVDGNDRRITFPKIDSIDFVQKSYLKRKFGNKINSKDSIPMMCLLFFSMLPLHADRPDRQKALLLNGLRCYKEYVLEIK